ncbi:TIGR04222 domain-containing membrane protein [Mycobacterium sp. E802]|uniref:TIGR04222 domain-containing membrane protein n=1 Tax=Mycobacterium sp. E802 TaxID=1834152 RepID=UPI000ADBF5BC|nr:TIGR04222 domain-containing membrane protein [Mycobacterium sp. E802]
MSIEKLIDWYASAMSDAGYGYLAVLAASVVFAVTWRIVMTPRKPAVTEPLNPTELAFLRSNVAPVVTALAGLRAANRITGDRRVDRTVATQETDPFTARVLARAAADPEHTVSGLFSASEDDLTELEQRLSDRGLVHSRAERATIRWGTAPLIMALILGVGYAIYLGPSLSEQPRLAVTFAAVVVTTVLCATLVLPHLLEVNRLTRAGRKLLAAKQVELAYLDPAKRPAFETYGAVGVALSVALFGTGALWVLDGDYSSSVELAGGDSGGGADGGGCGASCGGDGGGGGGCAGCGGCGGCGG